MPTVRLAFTAAPRYVRTARLVAAAVARRAGVAEETLDEVRLAVGEACARAVARHRRHRITDPIQVEMLDDGPYQVRVLDAAGPGDATGAGDAGDPPDAGTARASGGTASASGGTDGESGGMAETVLAGLVADLRVGDGEVRMVWPVRRRFGWR